jgi:glycosyltransferase involved in cell wall biosynthesis
MGFASAYLEKRALFTRQVNEAPDIDTGIIVVVPAYNEKDLLRMLDSLSECHAPGCKVEVIIVINAPADPSPEIVENNTKAFNDVESWKKKNKDCFFRLFAFMTAAHCISGWGVGLARKTGMDEAVRRFNDIEKPDGVILSLDADCTVEKNYFQAVANELLYKKDRTACSVYFEHPLSGKEFVEDLYKYITLYELHLRYYCRGLAYSHFPYAFHTVGSAMAVKAMVYIMEGGMNRKQAGEDFYFIQKLVPSEGYFSLNSTTVYPSPRVSDRVPFGTGASISKLSAGEGSGLLTYNPMAFRDLRHFFSLTSDFFVSSIDESCRFSKFFPDSIRSFLYEEEWIEKMIEIKGNTSGLSSFKKRFFGWFNMFKIVKYLNFVHSGIFEKIPVEEAAAQLLSLRGDEFESKDATGLLLYYRLLEKNQ